MTLDQTSRRPKEFLARAMRSHSRRITKIIAALITALILGILALVLNSHAAAPPLWGTLDTQTNTAATEDHAGVAMFELAWNSFEPTRGTVSASYLATMKSELAAYRAAGQQVTLGLGMENTPAWVFALPDSTYTDQKGNVWAGNADLVYSAAVRTAAAQYLSLVAANLPMADFWAIRLGSGSGDGEMLYPGNGTYMAFGNAALTGTGLAAGMTPNPDPSWKSEKVVPEDSQPTPTPAGSPAPPG